MSGRMPRIGIGVLCALVLAAVATASASAEQRAYTCTTTASIHDYNDEHCVTNLGGDTGSRGHTLISATNTQFVVTNEETSAGTVTRQPFKFKGTLAGTTVEVECVEAEGEGKLNNAGASVSITELIINYLKCKVTAPINKKCEVTGGTINTSKLTATTAGQPAGSLNFFSEAAQIASIPLSNCEKGVPPPGNYPLTGSYVATVSGATASVTEAGVTTQGTLKMGGVKAGLEGSLTMKMKEGSPIVLT